MLTLLVASQTLAGLWLFEGTVSGLPEGPAIVGLLAVFSVLFAWIGVGFWTAVFGFVMLRRGGDPLSLSRQTPASAQPPGAPTAVVLPIYHEPVQRTLNGLKSMIQDLDRQHSDASSAVDFYVLSDSRDPEIWLEEQAECERLRRQLGAHQRLFYRRRTINQNFKSGNIADFLRRWGRKYRYMVVLDADSLLSGRCIIRLIQLMEARPQAGIIQTAPRLARAKTRFARLQQFANRCYGRLYSAGLASIQLGEATYWGHNAILRVEPFMRHCGLRKLRGPGLFKGPVLSHDFVESALIGRAGYEVWLEPAIGGTFEESPPTLDDDLIRDQRWCRGNLQHLWLLATLRRVPLAHRMALVTGVLSYLASPLWLTFLALSGYAALIGPDSTPALPGMLVTADLGTETSPVFGPALLALTAVLLFGPRLLALLDQALARRLSRFGGLARLSLSTLQETLAALALAPIRMVVHTVHVLRALLNLTVHWRGQNRAGSYGLWQSLQRFSPAVMAAGGTLALVQWQAPTLTPWALPVCLPVLMAPVLAAWFNRASPEGTLPVPEHSIMPSVMRLAHTNNALINPANNGLSQVEQLVLSPRQARLCGPKRGAIRGHKRSNLQRLVDRCAREGQHGLSHGEMSLLCSHPQALDTLHLRAWQAEPDSPWRQALQRLTESLAEPINESTHPCKRGAKSTNPNASPESVPKKENASWIGAAS